MLPEMDKPAADIITRDRISSYVNTYNPRDSGFEVTQIDTWEDDFCYYVRLVGETQQEIASINDISIQSSGDGPSFGGTATMKMPEQASVTVKVPYNEPDDVVFDYLDDALEMLEKRFADADFTISNHNIIRDGDSYECTRCAECIELPEVYKDFDHEAQQRVLYAALAAFDSMSCDAVVYNV